MSARVQRATALALAIAVGACAGMAAAAEPKPLTLADLRKVVTGAEPQIAPDGTRIVYVRSRIDWAADRTNRELVLVDSSGDNARVLTHGRFNVRVPRWSPDGRRIAYLAGATYPTYQHTFPYNPYQPVSVTVTIPSTQTGLVQIGTPLDVDSPGGISRSDGDLSDADNISNHLIGP